MYLLFQAWPEDALERVAHRYLTEVSVSEHVKAAAVGVCKHFHVSARSVHVLQFNIVYFIILWKLF